jgi:hypothetical protein
MNHKILYILHWSMSKAAQSVVDSIISLNTHKIKENL